MNINPVGNGWQIQGLANGPVMREISPQTHSRATDRLELSGNSHLLAALRSNEVRVDKVAVVKAQIEAGTYESSEKLDVAVDRMLDEILK
jgi:anti-sigma28 factor (negative regulator of flagellin synthesis)